MTTKQQRISDAKHLYAVTIEAADRRLYETETNETKMLCDRTDEGAQSDYDSAMTLAVKEYRIVCRDAWKSLLAEVSK